MDKLAQEDHSSCPSSEDGQEIKKKKVYLTEQIRQKCTDETPIRLPRSSHNYEPSHTANLEKSDLNQSLFINTKGGIRLLLPVSHGGSGMKTGGAHNYIFFVAARSFTADGNLLQPTWGANRTPSHVTFSRVCTHV